MSPDQKFWVITLVILLGLMFGHRVRTPEERFGLALHIVTDGLLLAFALYTFVVRPLTHPH